jgi:hypothetical protein
VGYTQSGSSIFGRCVKCNCHGHSSNCHRQTGVCQVNVLKDFRGEVKGMHAPFSFGKGGCKRGAISIAYF